ncbi:hypothetical protein T4B_3006 [Trichinella pseudospiralis]|uniref:Uncharacterized protein n=1 Tax=Trichinella pseudospiralis TaxID=6337 RepID=A0A0V1JYF9_TRIPS|nr:hypothetical protein T4B_3006 [Trichinella pseudospiralis]KRZ40001.1 hypothetical protein T4C_4722 [Trichinella pseudospiralis]
MDTIITLKQRTRRAEACQLEILNEENEQLRPEEEEEEEESSALCVVRRVVCVVCLPSSTAGVTLVEIEKTFFMHVISSKQTQATINRRDFHLKICCID